MEDSSSIYEIPNKLGAVAAGTPPAATTTVINDTAVKPEVMNEVICDLQQCAGKTLGKIPPRDLGVAPPAPDAAARPNYVPPIGAGVRDFVGEHMRGRKNVAAAAGGGTLGDIGAVETLILVCVLIFFIFDMPVVRTLIVRMFPYFVGSDGNMSVAGSVVKSVIFGIVVYGINWIL